MKQIISLSLRSSEVGAVGELDSLLKGSIVLGGGTHLALLSRAPLSPHPKVTWLKDRPAPLKHGLGYMNPSGVFT